MTTEIINNSVSNQIFEDKDRNEASECFVNSLNPMKVEKESCLAAKRYLHRLWKIQNVSS